MNYTIYLLIVAGIIILLVGILSYMKFNKEGFRNTAVSGGQKNKNTQAIIKKTKKKPGLKKPNTIKSDTNKTTPASLQKQYNQKRRF